MRMLHSGDACWCCKCVYNSNSNVTVTLDLKQSSTMLGTNTATMFTQRCQNIVSTLVPNIGHQSCDNIHTTLPEHCLSVSPQCWERCCHKVHTILPGCCLNNDWHRPMLWQCCGNTGILVKMQCSHKIVWTSTQRCWDVWKHLQMNVTTNLGLTLRQHWHQRCDNVATTLEH